MYMQQHALTFPTNSTYEFVMAIDDDDEYDANEYVSSTYQFLIRCWNAFGRYRPRSNRGFF